MHNCRDYVRRWNEVLDSRGDRNPQVDRALAALAQGCPSCSRLHGGYRLLNEALRGWPPPVAPPASLDDRILRAWNRLEPDRRTRADWLRLTCLAATAASALVGVGMTVWWTSVRNAPRGRPAPIAAATPARPITESLTIATEATIRLALSTSSPAARVGLDVLESAARARPELPSDGLVPSDGLDAASGLVQSFRTGLNQGVRPITGTARQAFGFLLPASRPPRPLPSDRGA